MFTNNLQTNSLDSNCNKLYFKTKRPQIIPSILVLHSQTLGLAFTKTHSIHFYSSKGNYIPLPTRHFLKS